MEDEKMVSLMSIKENDITYEYGIKVSCDNSCRQIISTRDK